MQKSLSALQANRPGYRLATVESDFHMAETSPAPPRPRYPIESVDSALRLLALVADARAVSLSAAARHLDVAPSTAHRPG